MSLSGSLANALSGLNAMAFAAKTTSANIANAMTEGYTPRRVQLTAQTTGGLGGVQLVGVTAEQDKVLLHQLREARANVANDSALNSFQSAIEKIIGVPGTNGALSTLYDNFQSALTIAVGQPDSQSALQSLTYSAQDMTQALNGASRKIQDLRSEADQSINRTAETIRYGLSKIQSLNKLISERGGIKDDTLNLVEARNTQIARLNELIPVRIMSRDNGTVALYSKNGLSLLDPNPAKIEFSASNVVTTETSAENGTLGTLKINGQQITADTDLGGGSLGAQLKIRDSLGPQAQSALDEWAALLLAAGQSANVDPTVTNETSGVFSDAGGRFDSTNTAGVAGRITLNSAIEKDIPNSTWRWRDGMNAASQSGNAADGSLLAAFQTEIGSSPADRLDRLLDQIGTDRVASDTRIATSNAIYADLEETQAALGVDTDAELQTLLIIERNYSANARMIQTISDMMDQLIRI